MEKTKERNYILEDFDTNNLKCPVCSRKIPDWVYRSAVRGRILRCTICGARIRYLNGEMVLIGFNTKGS